MAKVKARSLKMTSLSRGEPSISSWFQCQHSGRQGLPDSEEVSHLGTAGLILDFSSLWSSWSRTVFSVLTMRRVAMTKVAFVAGGGLGFRVGEGREGGDSFGVPGVDLPCLTRPLSLI